MNLKLPRAYRVRIEDDMFGSGVVGERPTLQEAQALAESHAASFGNTLTPWQGTDQQGELMNHFTDRQHQFPAGYLITPLYD